jgi:hypothetical protein
MQYHVEIEPDTVSNWAAIPAYHDALINALGEDGVATMTADAANSMPAFLESAEAIYNNFMAASQV